MLPRKPVSSVLGALIAIGVLISAAGCTASKDPDPTPSQMTKVSLITNRDPCQNLTGYALAHTGKVYVNPRSINCVGGYLDTVSFEPGIFVVVRILKEDTSHVYNGYVMLIAGVSKIYDLDDPALEAKLAEEYKKTCVKTDCPWQEIHATLHNQSMISGISSTYNSPAK